MRSTSAMNRQVDHRELRCPSPPPPVFLERRSMMDRTNRISSSASLERRVTPPVPSRAPRASLLRLTALLGCAISFSSCDAPDEAPRVALRVEADDSALEPVTNDLGFEIELTTARIAVDDIKFTVAGEEHASSSVWRVFSDAVIPTAHAHPGHHQGGEVTGELLGEFVAEWFVSADADPLGEATLLTGTYSGANFTFGRGSLERLGGSDPLVGHTAILSGTATRTDQVVSFTIVIDSPEDRELVGAPFQATLGADASGTLKLRLHTRDEFEGDTLFDALDFMALDHDGDGAVVIEPGVAEVEDAYNTFRRGFQSHDFYSITYEE